MSSGALVDINNPLITSEQRGAALDWFVQNSTNIQSQKTLNKADSPIYLPWQKIRYQSWIPAELSAEQFWAIVKVARMLKSRDTPLCDEQGRPFRYVRLSGHEAFLHQLDLNTGGHLLGLDRLDGTERKSFIANSLMEEAIASSQLEGAHTTRREARRLLLEGREPVDRHQRMIINNHKAMQYIEEELKNQDLSVAMIQELHDMLAEGGAIEHGTPGQFRSDDDDVYVSAAQDDKIAHIPPTMAFVKQELEKLVVWANEEQREDGQSFTHPVIKAIQIHFWMGYLHPFADGNGRLARTLFYWYLLRRNYWAFAYIPLSTRIKKSPTAYGKAYIYSEQDDNDLTYFIDYNLRQIRLAMRDFQDYYEKRKAANRNMRELSAKLYEFNERQIRLIKYLSGDPSMRTNMTAYAQINGITPVTAIRDLKTMEEQGLLYKKRSGRNIFYFPTDSLRSLVDNDE